MVTVVCTRWLDAFPASYVRVLQSAVASNLVREHRFVCVTDHPEAFDGDADIQGVRMPNLGIPIKYQRRGCWPKLSIFQPGLLPASDPTLYLDLDVMVRGGLDVFFDRLQHVGGFHALREWNPVLWNLLPLRYRPHRGVQGSILGFVPEEQAELFGYFMKNRDACFERYQLDQDFLTANVRQAMDWPFDWTASFKWHCLRYWPMNRLRPQIIEPEHAKVIVFHGQPGPTDLVPLGCYRWGTPRKFGFGPVSWVRDYWLHHDPSWTDYVAEGRMEARRSDPGDPGQIKKRFWFQRWPYVAD